ncbi:MAG: protein kinase domain-containing protein [Myxococcota bacterium]
MTKPFQPSASVPAYEASESASDSEADSGSESAHNTRTDESGASHQESPSQDAHTPYTPRVVTQSLTHVFRIDRYTLLEELGQGGMGVVYRAWDPQLDRTVALKMLLWGGMAGEPQRRRLLQEARAIARLDHPGIVRIHDTGLHEGCPWYTMDYVAGPSLRMRLKQDGHFPAREAARILASLAQAVHHAHARGITHRDVKPGNVLLEDGVIPRLSDFGLAHFEDKDGQDLTLTGQVMGTPAYMAPEQAPGDLAWVGPLSDVFALGGVLYHLLAGHPPFAGVSPMELATRKTQAPPPFPAHASGIPPELALICHKALAHEPELRYPTALELAADLERFLRGEPVKVSRPGLGRRLRWWTRRHRVPLLFLSLALVLVPSTIGSFQAYEANQARAAQEQREAQARERLEALDRELLPLWQTNQEDAAARAVDSFVELPEVQGTRAPAQMRLRTGHHARDAGRQTPALKEYAQAYILAEHPEDRLDVLTSFSTLFDAHGDGSRLIALRSLIARDIPGWRTEPRLQGLLLALARADRDLQELTRRLGPDLKGPFSPVLAHLSRMTVLEQGRSGRFASTHRTFGMHQDYMPPRSQALLPPLTSSSDHIHPPEAQPRLIHAPSGQRFALPPLELGRWKGAEVFAIRTIDAAGQHPKAGLYRLEGSELKELVAFPSAILYSACIADMDEDGRPELYVSLERQLLSFVEDKDGHFRQLSPHRPTDLTNSIINALFVADLEGDGRPELVAALSQWGAYDLRVFHAGPSPGSLTLTARRKLGKLIDAAPFPLPGGKTGILALRNASLENTASFPATSPVGFPPGTYLLELLDGALQVRHHVPPPFPDASGDQLTVADLDGDGDADVLVRTRIPDRGPGTWDSTQIALTRPDGGFSTLMIPGLRVWTATETDGDPAAEVWVQDTGSQQVWMLGAGNASLPPLTHPAETLTGLETAPDVWGRIEDLISMGLLDIGVEQLRHLNAATKDQPGVRALIRAGKLADAQGRPALAVELYGLARTRDPQSTEAHRLAADAWAQLGKQAEERLARRALLEQSGLTAHERTATLTRIKHLEDELSLPELRLDFTHALASELIFPHPQLVRWNPSQGHLRVRALTGTQDLVRLPLRWDGKRLTAEFTLDVSRLEWGSSLELGFRFVGAAQPPLSYRFNVGGHGGGSRLEQAVAAWFARREMLGLFRQPISGPTAAMPISLKLSLDAASRAIYFEVNQTPTRYQLEPDEIPSPGSMEIYLAAPESYWTQGSLAEVRLKSITLKGATAAAGTGANLVDTAARRIVEGRDDEAQEVLAQATRADPLRCAILLAVMGCRHGSSEACFKQLEPLIRNGGITRPPVRTLLRMQLRENPAQILPWLEHHLGFAARQEFWEVWRSSLRAHRDDPALQLVVATILAGGAAPPYARPRTVDENGYELLLLRALGDVWLLLEQPTRARGVQLDALALAQRMTKVATGSMQTWFAKAAGEVELALAMGALANGQLSQVRQHLRGALAKSPVPELLADSAVALPELEPLLRDPEVRALLEPNSYVLPTKVPVHQ